MAFRTLSVFDTLAGRLWLILTLGFIIAAVTSLTAAEWFRDKELRHYRSERIAMSAADIADRLTHEETETRLALSENRILGGHLVAGTVKQGKQPDKALESALEKRFPPSAHATGFAGTLQDCYGRFHIDFNLRVVGYIPSAPECWIVSYIPAPNRDRITLGFDMPALPLPPSSALNPIFLIVIAVSAGALSYLVSASTLGFMRRLTSAANTFAKDIEADPVDIVGPRDVRETFQAFNHMQTRVREAMRDRTHILSAITHDLQTPLTRLRLRLENVRDATVRTRLLGDVGAMQRLVQEGLTLARASESTDDWVVVDLQSLLVSLTEDMIDTLDADIQLVDVGPAKLVSKPDAVVRCLQNLIENAVQYGGSARIHVEQSDAGARVLVRDEGPGLPQADLERMFEPFVRGEGSRSRRTGGTGIGLTISRAQAATFGGTVALSNDRPRGLTAALWIPSEPIGISPQT